MRIGVLIGKVKGKYVVVGNPGEDIQALKADFKKAIADGGKLGEKKLESLHLLTSSGIVKRKRFGSGVVNREAPKELEEAKAKLEARTAALSKLNRGQLEKLATDLKLNPEEIKTAPDLELLNMVLDAEVEPGFFDKARKFFKL